MPIIKPKKKPGKYNFVMKYCLVCGKKLKLNNNRDIERKKYCSHSCVFKDIHRKYPEMAAKNVAWHTEESRLKARETVSKNFKKGLYPEWEKRVRTLHSPEIRKKAGLKMRGENHWHWIEDRNQLKKQRHNSSERDRMDTWRKDVFEKFDYTCQKTKIKGGKLIAHHIFNWADYPLLRYDVDNGIVLSKESHKEFHKIYGHRHNNLQQINEFLEKP